MAKRDEPEDKILDALLQDQLSVEEYAKAVKVQESVRTSAHQRLLLAQITQFLMGILACTFVLWALAGIGIVKLPGSSVDKLGYLFGAEIVTLLGVIVRHLTKAKK